MMNNAVIKITLTGGEELEVKPQIVDIVGYELEAQKRGWGTFEETPVTFAAFVSWNYLTRVGQTSLDWREFLESIQAVDTVVQTEKKVT